MDAIRNWAVLACTSAVICGILSYLLPSKGSGKAGQTLISVFFLCSLVAPLSDSVRQIRLDFPQLQQEQQEWGAELQESSDQLAYSIAENHILELIEGALAEKQIQPLDIQLELDQSDSSVQLMLYLSPEDKNREEEIRSFIQSCGIQRVEFQWQEEQ